MKNIFKIASQLIRNFMYSAAAYFMDTNYRAAYEHANRYMVINLFS